MLTNNLALLALCLIRPAHSSFIQQQSVIRDEISTHSSPLENTAMQTGSGNETKNGSASGGVSNSLRASIESISTQISSLSLKLNAELLQLSAFEAAVSEQYREGESAQRHASKLLMQVYPGGDGRGGPSGTGVPTTLGGGPASAQMRSGVSLSDKLTLPSPYHWSKLQEWVTGVTALRSQVAVVEEYLATASASAHTNASFASPQALSHVLSAHHAALLAVTARVAALHEQVAVVRDKFTHMFGREGRMRLEEERNKEHQKKEGQSAHTRSKPCATNSTHASLLRKESAQPGDATLTRRFFVCFCVCGCVVASLQPSISTRPTQRRWCPRPRNPRRCNRRASRLLPRARGPRRLLRLAPLQSLRSHSAQLPQPVRPHSVRRLRPAQPPSVDSEQPPQRAHPPLEPRGPSERRVPFSTSDRPRCR